MAQTAELVIEGMERLRVSGHLTSSALEAFIVDPDKFGDESPAAMFRPITTAIIESLRSMPLIPKHKSGHIAAASARLARTKPLRSLVGGDQLASLCNAAEPLRWVAGDITSERTRELHAFLTDVLEVEEIDPASFVRRLSESFLKRQPDDWIEKLYEFLHDQPAVQKQFGFSSTPLVRLSNGSQVTALDGNKQPRAYLPAKRNTGFPTVKRSVCRSKNALAFLRHIGLKEPDPVDDVIRNVLPRYADKATEYPDEFDDDIERIVEAYRTDSEARRKHLVEELRAAWWIPCRNAANDDLVLGVAQDDTYFPTGKLATLFAGNKDVWFVDREHAAMKGESVRSILLACGVSEHLHRCECICDFSPLELRSMRKNAGVERISQGRPVDYMIDGLAVTLEQLESGQGNWQERARLLWQCLHDAIRESSDAFLIGEYVWWFNRDTRTVTFPAAFVRLLRQHAWLPGKSGMPQKPSHLCFSDLPIEFQTGANGTLVSLLEFKPDEVRQLAEKSGIDPDTIDLIREAGVTADDLRAMLKVAGRTPDESGGSPEVPDLESDSDDAPGPNTAKEENAEHDSPRAGPRDDQQHDLQTRGRNPRRGSAGSVSGSASASDNGQSGFDNDEAIDERRSRGHTADEREWMIDRLRRQLDQLTSVGALPTDTEPSNDSSPPTGLRSDATYRQAVLEYERQRLRDPFLKHELEEGHDIDSFVPDGRGGRLLARRIEVKGKGAAWTGKEIVEMSVRQFSDAATRRVEQSLALAVDFDYWLYIVEEDPVGSLVVLPIRNPTLRAARFEFRGGTWRHLVEEEAPIEGPESGSA